MNPSRAALRAAKGVAALCLLALPCADVVSAQSLAEVARKEQERRKLVQTPSKVYTNDDLRRVPGEPDSTSAAKPAAIDALKQKPEQAAGAKPTAPGEKPAAATEKPAPAPPAGPDPAARDEAYWRGRITQVRDNLQRNETFRDALQSRINALSTDFVNRDDPAQRAAIAFDRQKAIAELERVQSEIQQAGQQITAIEDEARRAGVPPGWLR